jgi:hypothetical protein
MKALGTLVAMILAGWVAVKVIPLAVRGLVHLLIAGLPVLGALAGFCLLLVVGSLITTRSQRRRSLRPSQPSVVLARRAASADPTLIPSPRLPIRSTSSAVRPAPTEYRSQPRAESGNAESSPALGSDRSGTLPASPGVRPVLHGPGVAGMGYCTSARPGSGTAMPGGPYSKRAGRLLARLVLPCPPGLWTFGPTFPRARRRYGQETWQARLTGAQ